MKKRWIAGICLSVLIGASVLGCAPQGNQAPTDTTTPVATTATSDATTAATTTAGDTTTAVVTTTTPKETHGEQEAMTSGTKDDFEAYFNPDITSYIRACDKAGTVEKITFRSNLLNADREAYVYLPYGYSRTETYPVVYLIHGIGCDGGQWISCSAAKIFDNMIANGEIAPFIAVCPSVIPADGIDKNTLSATNIQAFVDFVEDFKQTLQPVLRSKYSISTEREKNAICGLSMGGMEALRVGFTYLDRFAYIGSFSAAPTLETELLTTEGSEYTPKLVLLCSGDADNTVGQTPMGYHNELTKNGVEHIWYQHPGGGHSPDVWKLGLYNFLKRISW